MKHQSLLTIYVAASLFAMPALAQQEQGLPAPAPSATPPAMPDISGVPAMPPTMPDMSAGAPAIAPGDVVTEVPPATPGTTGQPAPAELFAAPAVAPTGSPTPATSSAEGLPLPPAPSFDPSTPFNPSAPFAAQPITPIQPQQVPALTAQKGGQGASTLPLPKDQEMFNFFQPGYQLGDENKKETAPPPEPVVEIAAPEKKEKVAKKLPLVRFNYKNQHLPDGVYKKRYDANNKHLPVARYESDYDQAAFATAASDNVNGMRALVEAGRDINMRNDRGETLAMVAAHSKAHNVLRYLMAKGADAEGAEEVAISRHDGQAYYTLKSVE